MLKRVLSMCLCLMLVLGTLGSITLTASAATVSENVKWNEDFTGATGTTNTSFNPDATRQLAFNQQYEWLSGDDSYKVFARYSYGTSNTNTFAAYLETIDGNTMLHYNPTVAADTGNSISFLRTFGTGHAGKDTSSTASFKYSDLTAEGSNYATSGAWNFSFDFKPVNHNTGILIQSFLSDNDVKALFNYADGAVKLLNNSTTVALAANEWHRVAFAADGTGKIEAYINGKKVAEQNVAGYWSKLTLLWIQLNKVNGTIGEWYIDNFKVSDQTSGFVGTGSAFDATVTTSNAELQIKDTASKSGATSTIVIPEYVASELSAEDFVDSLSYGFSNAAAVLYDADGEELDDYSSTVMNDVDKMVVSTGYATREYEIFVEQDTFVSSSYAVSHSDKTVSGVVKNVKVAEFLDAFSPIVGAELKVVNGETELTDEDGVTDGATLVATYSGNTYTYAINFKKYWSEDFSLAAGNITHSTNGMKYSDQTLVFDSKSSRILVTATDEAPVGYKYFADTGNVFSGTFEYLGSGYYNTGVYTGQMRHYLKGLKHANNQQDDIYVTTTLNHTLKSNGSPITTSGAYNLEFDFKPVVDYTNFKLDVVGVEEDATVATYLTYDKGAYKAFGQTLDLSSAVADSNGFYNFKIEYLGNGMSNVYVGDTKVGSNLVGGADIDTISFSIRAEDEGADFYIDNIDMYPVVYEAPASTTAVALYKDSVDDANVVTDNADLNATIKYIAKADITCYEASLPVMLMIASYSNGALNKVVCSPRTFAYGDTTDANPLTAEIDKSYVDDADRLCVFLWNGTSLKPYNFIEIK